MSTLAGSSTTATTTALVVAVEDYDIDGDQRRLDGLVDHVRQLADALTSSGAVHLAEADLVAGGTSAAIGPALTSFLLQTRSDRLILYWTGHGMPAGDGLYLLTRDSPLGGFHEYNSIPARALASWVANSPAEKILVVLDTCYSAQGAVALAQAMNAVSLSTTARAGQQRCIHVIATASAFDPRVSGVVSETLARLLRDQSSPHRRWGDGDEFIRCDDLTAALDASLRDHESVTQLVPKRDGFGDEFIPNPRFRGLLPPLDVDTKRQLLQADDHFLLAARGVEVDVTGWYFTGRQALLDDLVDWAHQPDPALRVLTGPPGTGKSAVIGRLVSLIHPAYRDLAASTGASDTNHTQLATDPVVVHAKGRTRNDVMNEIANQLELNVDRAHLVDLAAFLDAIRTRPEHPLIVVDAIDEAVVTDRAAIASTLLTGLVRTARCRVLVGSRRRVDATPPPTHADRHAQLHTLFGPDAAITDLDDELDTAKDISTYVTRRLREPSSHHRHSPAIDDIATAVADTADGSFLYARLVTRTLHDQVDLDATNLPLTAVDALRWDLESRLDTADVARAEALLAALAWARGAGVTRAVWPAMAEATAGQPGTYRQPDIAWALDHIGWHIIESTEDHQTVYRLAHQSFTDAFQATRDPAITNQRVVERLTADIRGADWLRTDRYLWRHISDHAATAHRLGPLLHDPGYLATAEPRRLASTLRVTPLQGDDATLAGIYRRTWQRLPPLPPDERMALIELAATQELQDATQQSLLQTLVPPVRTPWRVRCAAWQPSAVHETLDGHLGGVYSVAVGRVDGRDVIVSGGDEGTVRLWDPTGTTPAVVLEGHTGSVYSVAVGRVDGRDVIVSGGSDDGRVRVWDPTGTAPTVADEGHPKGVYSVAVGPVDGRDVIVSGGSDDGTVRVWDPSGTTPTAVLEGHTGWVGSVAVGQVDGRDVIVSGGGDGTVRVWDPTGTTPTVVHGGHRGSVRSVAVGRVDGRDVVVSGSGDGTVRVWDPTGTTAAVVLEGHTGSVYSVAAGRVDGRDVIVSGGDDGTVRVWDPTGTTPTVVLEGHTGSVYSVAAGRVDGRDVIVSGGKDGTVRVWDPTGTTPTVPHEGHRDSVYSVAAGQVDGRDVIVSGGKDGTVRVWDPTGTTPTVVLGGHTGSVRSVAVGRVDGRDVIVSGGDDSTVRVWDPTGATAAVALGGHTGWVRSVAVGRVDGRDVIVSGSRDRTVRMWDPTGATAAVALEGHTGSVRSVAIGRVDGRDVIVSGSDDGAVRVWDPTGTTAAVALEGHLAGVYSVAVGRVDGRDVIVSGGEDSAVRVWDPTGATAAVVLEGHTGWVGSVAVGRVDGRDVIVTGGRDGTVRAWDPTGTSPAVALEGHLGSVYSVAVGRADGRDVIVSGGEDSAVRVWDPTGTTPAVVLEGHIAGVGSAAIGRVDGRDVIVTGSEDGRVRVWDPTGTSPAVALEGHTGSVRSVAVGRVDGRDVIVSGSDDSTVRVWDPTGTSPAVALEGHTGSVRSVAVGRVDGRDVIVSGGEDSTVRVWDPTGTTAAVVLEGHTGSVRSVAAGRVDGRDVIVSGGEDSTVRVWDPTGTTPTVVLEGHPKGVGAVAVGRVDGRDVIVSGGGKDGTVRVWDPIGVRLAHGVDSLSVDPDATTNAIVVARGPTIEVTNLAELTLGAPGITIPLGFSPTSVAISGHLVAVGAARGLVVIDMTDVP